MGIFGKKQKDEDYLDEEFLNQESPISLGNFLKQEPSHALTPEEVLRGQRAPSASDGHALDSLKKRMLKATKKEEEVPPAINKIAFTISEPEPEEKDDGKSLLEKCKAYITDDSGENVLVKTAPIYELQSVAEILKSDSQKALERLSEKYNVSFDDMGKIETNTVSPTISVEETKEAAQKPQIFEDKISVETNIKNVQSSVPFVISDIDAPEALTPEKAQSNISNTATITFTPINESGAAAKIVVTEQTRPLDLTGELTQIEAETAEVETQVELEKNEFEEFVPENECKTETDVKKFLRMFSIKKRNKFLVCCTSILLTLILGFLALPFMTSAIYSHTRSMMIFSAIISFIVILLNADMFKNIITIFSKKANADIPPSLSSLAVAVYAIYGIVNNEVVLEMLLINSIILSFRSLLLFMKSSYMLSNLKQIAVSNQKSAVTLISDTAITFSMAKNAIEGDTLIAAPKKCDFVEDYIKYSTFGTFIKGKISFISIASLILSVIAGFVCAAYYEGVFDGLYTASAILCFASMPTLFMIDTLPLYSAAKKLNKKKAMIAGKTAAEHLEMANALVLNSIDLFPEGSVVLHQMKVLSENDLQDTIVRAASLTDSLNSPLSAIFKRIAGTGNITTYPVSDTVKYEDRMGISGWVDNRLLFIGNRTLMETHGIQVPSVEVDRKILRNGYFPIYVATGDNACALLMVQYNVSPEISHELRKLTNSGVTLLINNTDPNLTEEMICDYMGLYDDSVKVMSAAGTHMYRNAVYYEKNVSAPASFISSNKIILATILNCASRIKRSSLTLTVFYILSAIFGALFFAYSSFTLSGSLISSTSLLIYTLVASALSYILYLTQKP